MIVSIRLLEFERDRYREALEALADKLNDLAGEHGNKQFNDLWGIAYDALDPIKLAVAAAERGLLMEVFE
ncbi:hypothetical protein LCGC14_1391140 [marine sediment metagenome]|uniref:Uncharacterized protein n=1 Tax=marine sediment metagenome TaxID=412755 RepID=A0A0F9K056_9ZZZZ